MFLGGDTLVILADFKANPENTLMALNGSRGLIPTFVERKEVAARPPAKTEWRIKDEALHRETQEMFLTTMRWMADEWIESGKDPAGEGERPAMRSLTGRLKRYMERWARGNKLDVYFSDSGEWVIHPPAFKRNFTREGTPVTPLEAADQEAVRWFAILLDSPYRYRLCKCRLCAQYYYAERMSRGLIKYGTHCPRHRNLASARRSNQQRRIPERERKLDLAAQCYAALPKDLRDENQQAQRIADKLNKKVSSTWKPVKRNWVTRHWAEIRRRSLCSPSATN